MTIASISENDLTLCRDVIRKSFASVAHDFNLTQQNCPTHTSFITLDNLQYHARCGYNMFGLYDNDTLIGYAALEKRTREYKLHNLCVLPENRHSGGGKMLIDFCKRFSRDNGADSVTLSMINESEILKNYYIQNGFTVTGKKRFSHLPFTVCFMKCDLHN